MICSVSADLRLIDDWFNHENNSKSTNNCDYLSLLLLLLCNFLLFCSQLVTAIERQTAERKLSCRNLWQLKATNFAVRFFRNFCFVENRNVWNRANSLLFLFWLILKLRTKQNTFRDAQKLAYFRSRKFLHIICFDLFAKSLAASRAPKLRCSDTRTIHASRH